MFKKSEGDAEARENERIWERKGKERGSVLSRKEYENEREQSQDERERERERVKERIKKKKSEFYNLTIL